MIARLALGILALLLVAFIAHAPLPQAGAIKAQVAQDRTGAPSTPATLVTLHGLRSASNVLEMGACAAPAWPRNSAALIFAGIAGFSTSQHVIRGYVIAPSTTPNAAFAT